jgi:serine/threonine-protein kinase HipA
MTRTDRTLPRVSRLEVRTPQGDAGALGNERGSYQFAYPPQAMGAQAVSLLMPAHLAAYSSGVLPPVFSMNLPEGFLRDELHGRLAKVARINPLLLLGATGDAHPIGRITTSSAVLGEALPRAARSEAGENLEEILAWDGAEDLFRELLERYVFRSGISGVQPKVIVPERARAPTPDLIVKSGGGEFPHLALNEFVCMTIAKAAGLAVPEFWLSANRGLFVMRRFDSASDGSRLGFEDFAALTARQPERKYEGSYELIARTIRMFVSGQHLRAALEQLFDTVALSCAVGNGDAHLKNFGVLYRHPAADDVRLAPVYDVVNTTLYLPKDSLALSLGRTKSKAFAGRAGLLRFAASCEITDAERRLDRIEEAMVQTMETHGDLIDEAEGLRAALEAGLRRIQRAGPYRPASSVEPADGTDPAVPGM